MRTGGLSLSGRGASAAALTLLFALVVLGVRLLLVAAYGNATPSWDQWDGEATGLYLPWLNGSLGWQQMLAPFNEHRLFASRVLDLLLLEANNRIWNCILQMLADALLHVLALSYLFFNLLKCCPEPRRPLFLLAALLLFCIPFGWENLLWGFQSQFYFLLLFSFFFIGGVSTLEPLSWRWWLSVACGPLSALSLASGVLTLGVGALIVAARWLQRGRRHWPVPLVAAVLFGLALLAFKATPFTRLSEVYRSHSPDQFFDALNQVMSWPFLPWCVLVIYLPLGRFMIGQLRRPAPEQDPGWFLFGIGLWVFGQCVGIAYGRAAVVLSSRYQDLLVLGLLLNVLCLLMQYRTIPGTGLRSRYRFYQLWLLIVALGTGLEMPDIGRSIAYRADSGQAQEAKLRAWLATSPPGPLQGKPAWDIPYPAIDDLVRFLETPAIRSILPGNILPANQPRQPWLVTTLLAHLQALGTICLLAGVLLSLRLLRTAPEAP